MKTKTRALHELYTKKHGVSYGEGQWFHPTYIKWLEDSFNEAVGIIEKAMYESENCIENESYEILSDYWENFMIETQERKA